MANRTEEISAVAAGVEGWLSEAQGRTLMSMAAAVTGRGAIVEIGSWKGRSTVWLAAGGKAAGQRVYAIDRHTGSREDPSAHTLSEFLDNLACAGVRDSVEPLVMSSAEASELVRGPVELLFVDGDHSFEGVQRDADLWLPRIVEGGIVLFHDVATAGYDGPRRIFRQRICWSPQFGEIRRVGSMMLARRVRRRGVLSSIWGSVAGVLLYVFDAKQLSRKLRKGRGEKGDHDFVMPHQ